jgi:ubiquinone/menaquinone biosynthesis C-methylase UbiE
MGLIFDQRLDQIYDSWQSSRQGQALHGALKDGVKTLLDPRPGERILDIGCGSGRHLSILKDLGLSMSGLDASPYMLERAERRLGLRCSLTVGRAEDLPFEDNEFDLVILIHTLEFLDDPLPALREAARVARRKVFVGIQNSLSFKGLFIRVQGQFGNPLFSHLKLYDLWTLKSLMESAYGPVPISWTCIPGKRSPFHGLARSPFACFLGVSAAIVCRMRANPLPLKIRWKEAGQPLVGARSVADLHRDGGVHGHTRGLSLRTGERPGGPLSPL